MEFVLDEFLRDEEYGVYFFDIDRDNYRIE